MKNFENESPVTSSVVPSKILEKILPQSQVSRSSKVVGLPVEHDQEDLVCFSHLRWDFVFQRPQHLLSRFALERRVFFVEEPVFDGYVDGSLDIKTSREGVTVVTPRLRPNLSEQEINGKLRLLVDQLISKHVSKNYLFWYYTPMALPFTRHLKPQAVVYDCMDELSLFKGAHPALLRREEELLARSNVVFTGGHSLYQAKKNQHSNIHPMPSSIDKEHFGQARNNLADPSDQAHIPHPRIGFFGVIDERLDIELLTKVAELRPDYQFVMIGPVVKIDPATLPRFTNVHYLGGKSYNELPNYLGNWDAAMLPMALNEATKFISPTKTPEYLAGGASVVSTPINDVVTPYGVNGLVNIAASPEEFAAALDKALSQKEDRLWREKVDRYLTQISWNDTWTRMNSLMTGCLSSAGKRVVA